MSRTIFDAPTTFPSAFRIGDTVSETMMLLAVFAAANCLEMFDVFLASNSAEDMRRFVDPLGRHEDRDRTAHHFFGLVAEHLRAPMFQLVMLPIRSLLMMASSDETTIAARRAVASSAAFVSVMSLCVAPGAE
jgi:hypothetical protein